MTNSRRSLTNESRPRRSCLTQLVAVTTLTVAVFVVQPATPLHAEAKPAILDHEPASQIFPKLPQTPNDPHLTNSRVYPMWGPVCQRYTYSVVYQDDEGRPPEYIRMYFNGDWIDLQKADPNENNYKKGVKYSYQYVPTKLTSYFYFFEASNGLGKARDGIIDSPDNGPVLFESDFTQNEIAVIDTTLGEKTWSFPTEREWIGGIALSDDGRYLAAKTTQHIYLFDTRSNKPLWVYTVPTKMPPGGDVKGGIDISADGSQIFAAIGNSVLLFNRDSNEPIWSSPIGDNAYNVAISADGNYVAAGTAGEETNLNANLVILWNRQSKTPLWQYHASGNFHDVTLSADGSYLAAGTGCPDRRAYIFSRDSNVPLVKSEMLTKDSPVNRAKISANGEYAAFSAEYEDGLVFLFSKDSSQPLWQFPAPHGRSGRALSLTPDGQSILETTFGGEVFIFDRSSNQPVSSWQIVGSLGAADLSDDGQLAAVGGTGKTLYLIDRDTATPRAEIPFSEYLSEIDISGDGRFIGAGTGGANYFFESFWSQEGKTFTCDKITEPEPEAALMGNGMKDGGEELGRDGQLGTKNPLPPVPMIVLGALSLTSLIALAAYLLIIKYRRLPQTENAEERPKPQTPNRRIIIALAATSLVTLGAAIILGLTQTDKPTQTPVTKTETGENRCGNSLCENDRGESQETCPQDCNTE